ncbi:hypothetical protein K438DRAFT_2029136 [Mycena galopus ATCC 62051]|nr:hypothetical protein K438DRAFT_2029136 [Mycena galopus ATCC 62051]
MRRASCAQTRLDFVYGGGMRATTECGFYESGGLWTATKLALIKQFVRKPELHTPALLWFSASSAADVGITVGLVWTLTHRKTGFVATDSVIDKIIWSEPASFSPPSLPPTPPAADDPNRPRDVRLPLLALHVLTDPRKYSSIFSVLDIIFFMVFPHLALNFVWDLPLSKLYSNALLSTLNARAVLGSMSGSRARFGSGPHSAPRGTHTETHTGRLVFEDMALVTTDGQTQTELATKFEDFDGDEQVRALDVLKLEPPLRHAAWSLTPASAPLSPNALPLLPAVGPSHCIVSSTLDLPIC